MTTFAGVITALGFVLVVVAAVLALVRRLVRVPATRGGVRLEVLGRTALGPKQGIAVVRMGGRVVAVSSGEGGVSLLCELDAADLEPPVERTVDQRAAAERALPEAVPAFARQLQERLSRLARPGRAAAVGLLLLAGLGGALALTAEPAAAQAAQGLLGAAGPQVELEVGGGAEDGGLQLSGTVGVVVMMSLLALLPTLVLMMTSFTRILIVLSFLKQAMGTQTAPPAPLVAAFALLLTSFVMGPTFAEANRVAMDPWLAGEIDQATMLERGVVPFRSFMLAQTRPSDVDAFVDMARLEPAPASIDEVPLRVLLSAFVTSELKTAFQIGFALFLPFIVIDVVVASVLMSMGMFMLPPAMISLPFKLLLFVLVDGWTLVVQSLVASFR